MFLFSRAGDFKVVNINVEFFWSWETDPPNKFWNTLSIHGLV